MKISNILKANSYTNHSKYLQRIFYMTLIILLPFAGQSQNCKHFHAKKCKYNPESDYSYSGQSRSALFSRGQTSEFKIVVFGGKDYSISVCGYKKFGDIQFKIIEDNEERTVLHDNAKAEYSEMVLFENKSTRNLIIQITVPFDESARDSREKGCVGVLIEYRDTDSTGF